ncbi:hypothetical protein K402DRAFT_424969 [Aulographum hederae CBS 113979]|uniref:Uncharacterized protein n=1 Tax=Aulographum hederae CBS 113979 TaxID=1176131 RepID=A0A6G1GMG0_9PEZI|nr:hypothetical protein K402DRAFT_424969 [Aulographum hederae CBS 113979]
MTQDHKEPLTTTKSSPSPNPTPNPTTDPKQAYLTACTPTRTPVSQPTPSPTPTPQPAKKWYQRTPKAAPGEWDAEAWDAARREDWKKWQEENDKQRSTARYYTNFYRAKGGWAWWVGLFGS